MIALLWMSGLAHAASVEVSPGDDIATLTASLGPGDEIVFDDGTYPISTTLYWSGVGTADAPITLRAKDGAAPIIQETGAYLIVDIEDSSYITIDGIAFQGDDAYGVSYGVYIKDSTNITVKNCEIATTSSTLLYLDGTDTDLDISHNQIHDTTSGSGIYAGCSDASCWTESSTFSNNWIHDIASTYSDGFQLSPGGQGNTITDNVIHDVAYRGLRVDSTEYGDPNTVERNVIWNANDVGLDVRGGSRVRNNIVFNITGIGIKTADNDRDTLDDVVISFNTVVNTTGYAADIEDWAGRTGNVFANNALCNPTGYSIAIADSGDTGQSDYGLIENNLVCGLVDVPDVLATSYASGAAYDDYVDPEVWDFYPTHSSHLVDAADPSGTTYVPDDDFNGAARSGDHPDIGAYEWVGEGNPGWAISEDFKDLSIDVSGADAEVGGGCCGGKDSSSGAVFLLPLVGLGWTLRRRLIKGNGFSL